MSKYKDFVKYMTEETSYYNKEGIIKIAVIPKQITLFTREFGRGLDFITHDNDLDKKGGIFVIQTFLSDD